MDLLTRDQIRTWDRYTIEQESLSSMDLVERASMVFVKWFSSIYADKNIPVCVLAGSGNNGSDGLFVARILIEMGYLVRVHHMLFGSSTSPENEATSKDLGLRCVYTEFTSFPLEKNEVVIDALLGSGTNGALKGEYFKAVEYINGKKNIVLSIDMPSGLNADQHFDGNYVKAKKVLTFQVPKRSFFSHQIPWTCRSIGLSSSYLNGLDSKYKCITRSLAKKLIRGRLPSQSKYDFGFGQLCGGSLGMLGAIILAARAALRCGIGRLSVTIPKQHYSSFLHACPEAMVTTCISETKDDFPKYQKSKKQISAIGVGPGLSTSASAVSYLDSLLRIEDKSLVLDADALNLIARNNWQTRIPRNTIISPHATEFDRLFGVHTSRSERINKQIKKSSELGIYILLKGANTSISTPDGYCFFNTTGNVGMASAGSGDVLTGMLTSFLAQSYDPLSASILATYLHGLAGDRAQLEFGSISMKAGDIIDFLPEVIKHLNEE